MLWLLLIMLLAGPPLALFCLYSACHLINFLINWKIDSRITGKWFP